MKLHILFKLWGALLLCCTAACQGNSGERALDASASNTGTTPTVIYVVRHAEKDTSDARNEDPALTPAGEARAEALRALLEGQEVDALFTTKYIRNKNTLKPLAEAKQLEMQEYEAHDFSNLKEQILQHHQGETVVVVGHSNTVLPIIEEFGAAKPVAAIPDSEYTYLFKLTVTPDGAATVETDRFGASSTE
ncbi:phosphoglycerate mutase family protein [Pontibacter saemangeumensis]|uniref:Phosphoglycerate mutase family protein n=1 Tax=Pontibacter saemangeumensis TaxID=1084525 RepID=A0ABP8M659_9BACT